MVEVLKKGERDEFTLRGKGYNCMFQKPDKWGKFKVDLVLTDEDQIKLAKEMSEKYGLKIKDSFSYALDGETITKKDVAVITLRRNYDDKSKYPTTFVPTRDASTQEVITDFISHGADIEVKVQVYGYEGGPSWKAGNGFQLNSVRVHSYTPFKASSAA